ncbi:MAG: DUF302 domain-containing protein [Gammaproteobacteria bacterium]|nr:MAG: DUF302 domain-containing protein [Gammaproteobacteria bacterium]
MRKIMLTIVATMLLQAVPATHVQAGDNGLVMKRSPYSVSETIKRLESLLRRKGFTIFAVVDHWAGARKAGIKLRPTKLLIFGNPKVGSHFFTSKQTAGIDLPMKALAWKDARGQVWLAYNDPKYIANRHGINNRPEIVKKMTGALDNFTNMAVKK